jgi:hypothetical protein
MLAPVRIPVANTSDEDPLMKQPSCSGNLTSPNSTCRAITSLNTLGAVNGFSYHPTVANIESLLLVGLGSGEFGAVSFTQETIAGHWRLGIDPILHIRSVFMFSDTLSRYGSPFVGVSLFDIFLTASPGLPRYFSPQLTSNSSVYMRLVLMGQRIP